MLTQVNGPQALKRDPWEVFFRIRQSVAEAMMLTVEYVPPKMSAAARRLAVIIFNHLQFPAGCAPA
jgi:hypothetical protein